ncbi:metal ABC transporter permease [Oryzibacter oryziterrae]|uniref:metal ABC transporter permease n=1 Tax=Oryzibacter oryziterrae TaxID=2766474 RepID=UPI001F48420B|nr:metal ABC transporter permease [Oryzibacter oryziterrae]
MSPFDLVQPFADFAFMRRALVGTLILSVTAAPIGVFLLLRRLSLTGDAMAHAILPGAAIGYLLAGLNIYAMSIGAVGAGLLIALAASAVTRLTPLREDASLACFYLISLALGVTIVSLKGSQLDLMHLLFGSVLALDDTTIVFIAFVCSVTLVVLAVIWRALVLECIDPAFLRVVGGQGAWVHLTFMVIMVLNLVAGYQALGTLLSVGLMMLPAATARFWTRTLGALTFLAIASAMMAAFAGLLISYYLSLPSGPAIILVAGSFYLISVLFGPVGGIVTSRLPSRHRIA